MAKRPTPVPAKKPIVAKRQGGQQQLPIEVKTFMVVRFAMWNTPSEVVAMVKEEFGIDVPTNTARMYRCTDADQRDTKNRVSKELVDLFHATREAHTKELARHPVAERGYRLHKIGEMVEKCIARNNFGMASKLLEQAAKEAGNQFTNVQKVEGKVAHTLRKTVEEEAEELSDEERFNILEVKLRERLRQRAALN